MKKELIIRKSGKGMSLSYHLTVDRLHDKGHKVACLSDTTQMFLDFNKDKFKKVYTSLPKISLIGIDGKPIKENEN